MLAFISILKANFKYYNERSLERYLFSLSTNPKTFQTLKEMKLISLFEICLGIEFLLLIFDPENSLAAKLFFQSERNNNLFPYQNLY